MCHQPSALGAVLPGEGLVVWDLEMRRWSRERKGLADIWRGEERREEGRAEPQSLAPSLVRPEREKRMSTAGQ